MQHHQTLQIGIAILVWFSLIYSTYKIFAYILKLNVVEKIDTLTVSDPNNLIRRKTEKYFPILISIFFADYINKLIAENIGWYIEKGISLLSLIAFLAITLLASRDIMNEIGSYVKRSALLIIFSALSILVAQSYFENGTVSKDFISVSPVILLGFVVSTLESIGLSVYIISAVLGTITALAVIFEKLV